MLQGRRVQWPQQNEPVIELRIECEIPLPGHKSFRLQNDGRENTEQTEITEPSFGFFRLFRYFRLFRILS